MLHCADARAKGMVTISSRIKRVLRGEPAALRALQ